MNKDKLRILVVEDNEWHQEQARRQLQAHSLTVVGTYVEAVEHLRLDRKTYREFEEEVFVKKNSSYSKPEVEFEVLLTDLHIPFAKNPVYPIPGDKFTGKPQGLGYGLVILGALQNLPYIGLLSHVNHHHNEFAASIDEFERATRMKINELGNSRLISRNDKEFGRVLEQLLKREER